MTKSAIGLQAVKEMTVQGTKVQTIDGDSDNSLIAHAKTQWGISLTKKLQSYHSVKIIVKPKSKD